MSVLLCWVLGGAVASAGGFDFATGGLVAVGVSLLAGHFLPLDALCEGVLTEIWTGELVKKNKAGLDGSWLNGIPDASGKVDNDVIHLVDEPLKALNELDRVCRPGGKLIIPTYMNKDRKGKTSGFASVVGKAGADFKRQFTVESYRQFFLDAGYKDVKISLAEGRIPCAVAVMTKEA